MYRQIVKYSQRCRFTPSWQLPEDIKLSYIKYCALTKYLKFCFCFSAAGCTTVKTLVESLAGVLHNRTGSSNAAMYIWRENVHGPWERKLSLLSLNQNETELILSSYYKFMILRDPVERILSAYKSKVGETLQLPLNWALYDGMEGWSIPVSMYLLDLVQYLQPARLPFSGNIMQCQCFWRSISGTLNNIIVM